MLMYLELTQGIFNRWKQLVFQHVVLNYVKSGLVSVVVVVVVDDNDD